MTVGTRVYELEPAAAARLEVSLRERLPPQAEWRDVPHAAFSVRAEGVVLTCYRSGKLVLQGRGLEVFEERFLADVPRRTPRAGGRRGPDTTAPSTGSDEAGKGDYFGPLVVAAVRIEEADVAWLQELRAADSKTLADASVVRMAGAIERRLAHAVVSLPPPEYNRRYRATPNLNTLLAELHAEALGAIEGREPNEPIVVDRFAAEEVLLSALRARGVRTGQVVQVPRAESHAAVAAASILARAAFLEGLAACARECATELPKGAGTAVDAAARRVVAIGGKALLERVAKLHFKNTARVLAGRRNP